MSAEEVKRLFVAMIKVFPKDYGWRLDRKPLAEY
jgi:hypothetical protein